MKERTIGEAIAGDGVAVVNRDIGELRMLICAGVYGHTGTDINLRY